MSAAIGIVGMGSISALGNNREAVWKAYQKPASLIQYRTDLAAFVCELDRVGAQRISALQRTNKNYLALDRSVLLGMLAAEQAVNQAGWKTDSLYGINIGSSRGATEKFEKYHEAFTAGVGNKFSPLSSPTTTLGNLSYWVGNHLSQQGLHFDHSITCSSALHSVLNGIAWLKSGLSEQFLVGGTEAPLTAFTLAQMKALRIYAKDSQVAFPCRSLDLEKTQNTMVLGEGAACFALSKNLDNALAIIEGYGFASEKVSHHTAISKNGDSLFESMQTAIQHINQDEVDLVVCHSPGTCQGDLAERKAIQRLFGKNIPALTTNKWKIGHTLGASGAMSMEMVILMLQQQSLVASPPWLSTAKTPEKLERILFNAIGFGGNAVSLLLRKN
ncbi:MAG: beta-ketoacyl synthase N-terminal-like domain-containing protein [Saprospiraceae bacterium]